MTAQPPARLRADARRNRDQILVAAKAVFAELGPDVAMEEIARRAGVGVGTLYRRFPDRDALIRAVARENFGSVLDEARAATAEEPTAWDALVRLMGRSRELRLSVRLAVLSRPAWAAIRDDPEIGRLRDGIMAVLDDLVRGAQAEGVLRSDVGTGDVAALLSLLLRRVPADSDELADLILERALVLILDGLRALPGATSPGTTPSGTGAAPSGTPPAGAAPSDTGAAPAGTSPSGTALPGAPPSGTALPGAAPSGAAPAGTPPSGAPPSGVPPSGTVLPGRPVTARDIGLG